MIVLLKLSVVLAIVVGLPLGVVIAVVSLVLFRARVARSMRQISPNLVIRESAAIFAPTLRRSRQRKEALVLDLTDTGKVLSGCSAAARVAGLAKRLAWRVAVVYAMALSVYALILANVPRLLFGSPINYNDLSLREIAILELLYYQAFSCLYASPAVFAATYVQRKQLRYLIVPMLALLAIIWIFGVFEVWINFGFAVPTAVALLLATRRLRAVGPVVIVSTVLWIVVSFSITFAGFTYALDLGGAYIDRPDLQGRNALATMLEHAASQAEVGKFASLEEAFRSADSLPLKLKYPHHMGAAIVAMATLLIAIIAGAVAAWAGASWLASRYRRRRASDQMLAIDLIVFAFTLHVILYVLLVPGYKQLDGSITIIFVSATAFIAYKILAAIGFRILRKSNPPELPKSLLLLRVFAFARRSQRLLDNLGQRWRYLGPIRLIAGTDLAYTALEPHEFYDFLSGRLSRAFVRDEEELEGRLGKISPVPDPDGLFRVQNFYCHDDTWRMTVARLARESEAVFMDLRGFTASNRGCIYELEILIQVVPTDRIVLLIDKTTDVSLLERTLALAWETHPRNNVPKKPTVRVLQASRNHWRTLGALVTMLCTPSSA